MIDVIQVVVDALAQFFGVEFSAQTVDLGPTGNSRLDALARGVPLDYLIERISFNFGFRRVRPRSNDRHFAAQHIYQLRQFIEELLSKVDGAVKSRFLMRVGWIIIVHVYFTRPTDRRIV